MLQSHITSPRRSTKIIWLLTLLLWLAFGLRVWRAAHDSIWFDEAFTAWMARLPLQEMVFRTAHDTAPPLYYASLAGWRALAGEEVIVLKMLSIFCGMLTVAISYQIGHEVAQRSDYPRLGQQAGLAGMLLVTVAWPQIWSSQEIRQYGMAGFLAALSLWTALRLFNRPKRPWLPALVLAISMGAGLLTHYLFVQVPLVLNLAFVYVFLTSRHRWKLTGVWVIVQVVALAMLIPWLFYSWGVIRRTDSGDPLGLWSLIILYLSVIFIGVEAELGKYVLSCLAGTIGLISSGAASLAAARPGRRHGWVVLALSTVLPIILVYVATLPALNFYRPPTAGRYLVLLSTAVYVLMGWGVAALTRLGQNPVTVRVGRAIGIGLLAMLAGLSIWGIERYYSGNMLRDDYLSAATTLEIMRQPGDAVILNNDTDWPVFAYHYPDETAAYFTQQRLGAIQDAEHLLGPYLQGNDGIWLVQNRFGAASDPNDYLRQMLESRALAWRHYAFPETELWFYALTIGRAAPDRLDQAGHWPAEFVRYDAPIADGVRLVGYTHPAPEVDAGDVFVIGLGWQVEAGITGQWTVAAKITGTDGQEIASTLVTLDGSDGEHFTPIEIFLPPDAPTGQASVALIAGPYYAPLTAVTIRPTAWAKTGPVVLPPSTTAMGIHYGESIILKAAQLPDHATWQPGESIPLTFYWQPVATIPQRYKVFVHLIGEQVNPATGNTLWGQQDQEPQDGRAQTTRWLPGELISDEYWIAIGDTIPPGDYTLQVGLYPLLGGTRLPAVDQSGKSLGDSVIVYEFEVLP